MKKLIPILSVLFLIAGCDHTLPPAESGSFELHKMVAGIDRVTTGKLSDAQIQKLSQWLRDRRSGWEYKIEDTAPGLLIHFKAKNTAFTVNILDRLVQAGSYYRSITAEERAVLDSILETNNG